MIHVYNTRNCAVISKFRRGMDPAHIFDLSFSPSGAMLACTSDKGTLHIFDVARPGSRDNNTPGSRPSSSGSASVANAAAAAMPTNGWGWLAKVPLLPKAFSDTYSFASAKFELGAEPEGAPEVGEATALGTTKAQKGVIGWFTEEDLVVVGAGFDAKWEQFRMADMDNGQSFVARIGWKRFYNEKQ